MIKVSFLSILILFVTSSSLSANKFYDTKVLTNDTIWEGEVIVAGKIVVDRKATLKIKPGTKILFKKVDVDNDGLSESTIIVNGNIIVEGSKENPVYFTSLEDKKDWGDWKEIQINHAKGFAFSYTIFEYSEYGIHVHFSEGLVSNCIFRKNGDATRLGNSVITFVNNLFENNNGKALNFTNCKIIFKNNTLRNNREGVFVFEKVGEAVIEHNNIYNNNVNVKTGDFFKGKLVLGENFFGEKTLVQENVEFKVTKKPYFWILPDILDSYIVKVIDTNGFVDGAASHNEDKVFFTSFDGNLYYYSPNTETLQKFFIGDFIDCKPLVTDKYVVVVDWGGKVSAIDFNENKQLWSVQLDKSLKDDHRMPSPVLLNDKVVLVARPDGKVYFLGLDTGKILKKISLNDELRATPLVFDERVYLCGTHGNVYSLDVTKETVSNVKFDASFYSPPIIFKKFIVFLDVEGKLFFVDRGLKLHRLIKLEGTFRHQSPVEFMGKLYLFSLNGKLFIVDNALLETINFNEIFTATPAVVEDFLLVTTFSGKLLFYSKNKNFYLGGLGEIQFEPHIFGRYVYLGTRSNKIYVIKVW